MKEESGYSQTVKDIEEVTILAENGKMESNLVAINESEARQLDRDNAIKQAEEYLGGQKYDLKRITVEVGAQFGVAANAFVEIGKRLLAVKHVEGHGNFLQWLQSNFPLSTRTANNYMQIAEKINRQPELAALAKAGPSKAVILLNMAEEYHEEFVLEGTIDGKPLDELQLLSREELQTRIKQLQKNQDQIISEETKSLKAENKDLLEENELLKKNQNTGSKTPEWLEEKLLEIDRSVTMTVSLISEITNNDGFEVEAHTLAKFEQPLRRSQQSVENAMHHIDDLFHEITG